MKSIFLLLFLTCQFLAITSCDKQPRKRTTSEVVQMDSMINSILSQYPNYATNDLVMADAEKEFRKQLKSVYKDVNYIDDYKFEVFRIADNPNGEGYIIHLNRAEEYNLLNILGDVICMTTDTVMAKSIDKTKKYRVKTCQKSALLSEDELKFISINWEIKSYNTPNAYLKKGFNGINANIGVMLCLFAEVVESTTD